MYVDELFLENMVMNYVILYLTARFGRVDYKIYRLIIASSIGAIYVIIMFLPNLRFMQDFTTKLVLSMLIIIVAFSPTRILEFIRISSIFYMISFAFGGASIALFYLTGQNQSLKNSIYFTAIGTLFAIIVISIAINYVHTKNNRNRLNVHIVISVDNKSQDVAALIDTGNSLYDPLSHWPVIIVEFEQLRDLLPQNICDLYKNGQDRDLNCLTNALVNSDWASKVRMIPFMSLDKENGMLLGFKPDEVIIKGEEPKKVKNVIIGIYNKALSKEHEYTALLHPDVL